MRSPPPHLAEDEHGAAGQISPGAMDGAGRQNRPHVQFPQSAHSESKELAPTFLRRKVASLICAQWNATAEKRKARGMRAVL